MTIPFSPIWCDGTWTTHEDSALYLTMPALRYSQVVFDACTVHLSGENDKRYRIIGTALHVERFIECCDALGFECAYDAETLLEVVHQLVRRNAPSRSCGVRAFAYRTAGDFCGSDNTSISVFLMKLPDVVPDMPIKLLVGPIRSSKADLPRQLKSTSHYAGARQAVTTARRDGYTDVLFLSEDGYVTESSRAAVVFRKGNDFFVPPIEAGVLPSITRRVVMEIVTSSPGLRWFEDLIVPEQLTTFDRAYFCSASVGVLPISSAGVAQFETETTGDGVIVEFARMQGFEKVMLPNFVDEFH